VSLKNEIQNFYSNKKFFEENNLKEMTLKNNIIDEESEKPALNSDDESMKSYFTEKQ
jgi:hypothetical protein